MTITVRATILLGVLLMGACGQPKPPAPPPQFHITLSRSGGFTGMASGHHLGSDGTLAAWRRGLAQPEQIAWSKTYAVDEIAAWAEDLHGATQGWLSQETGNMTSNLTFVRGDSTRVWTWAGTGPPSKAPQALVEWLQAFNQFTRDAAPQ